ncbi:GSCFA domain-containing protein [Oceanicella sp. SM1341]|uniref:GSCFA domain-containing protein n=1 Tax=Oceanicella sp. SM1341 TaxID=1548889 RepID=UPI000E48A26C|nr:GSCFA domain-containing protein [Oceanicella sp. SM1341]
MRSPYENLPSEAFWRAAVAERHPQDMEGLYKRKFDILPETKIVTAGSCFAQHLGRHLKRRGFNVLDKERAPVGLSEAEAQRFGYQLYSARYGNIYTVRQLLQLLQEATGKGWMEIEGWEKNGRWYDPQRPTVEPSGLDSLDELIEHRRQHLRRVRSAFSEAQVFVFTFGLTEAWERCDTGRVYPTAPGTIAGSYDPEKTRFKNFRFEEIMSDFLKVVDIVREFNPDIRVLTTVSPVPLTATATGNHVLTATSYSKSVLRAVTGQLSEDSAFIDYFPSYEIVTAPSSRGFYFEPNLRSVNKAGVDRVMEIFLGAHGADIADPSAARKSNTARRRARLSSEDDVVCEEIMLDAFSK